jgi:hypothetical protein
VRGWRDRNERFELRDAWGRDIGRLLQNNGHLAGLRTFALESGQAQLGHTTYDYTLTFEYPPYEPMGILCLAVVLSEYFYRRTEHGGALRGIPGV